MTWGGISEDLRRLRKERDMSLVQVARLAGTSVATVSRYESGWTRFELSTLRKLATALGYRLEITWKPLAERNESEPLLIQRIARLFWDRPLTQGDMQRFPDWIVGRVIQYGKAQDIRALAGFLGRERFLGILSGIRMPSRKAERFWQAMLRLEGMSCMKKPSRPQAGTSWPD